MADMIDTSTAAIAKLIDATENLNSTCDAMWNDHERLEENPSRFGQPYRLKESHVRAISEAQQSLPPVLSAARDLVPALLSERDALRAKLDAAVDALGFYADRDNYEPVYERMPCDCCTDIYEPVKRDEGDIARATIAKIKEMNHG